MNIIIEGPDATGKTTLVEKILAKHPNMTLLHDTGKTKNDKEYYMSLLEKDNYIFDRFHLSEYIFPQIYGRPAKLTWQDFNEITDGLDARHTYMIIFISSDINILKNRLAERGEYDYFKEIVPQEELFELYGNYISKMYNFGAQNIFVADIAKNGYELLDEWLKEKEII